MCATRAGAIFGEVVFKINILRQKLVMIVSSCLQVDLIYHYCNRRNSFRYFSALINIISIVKIILCTARFFFFMCKRPQLMRMTLLGPLRVQTIGFFWVYFCFEIYPFFQKNGYIANGYISNIFKKWVYFSNIYAQKSAFT